MSDAFWWLSLMAATFGCLVGVFVPRVDGLYVLSAFGASALFSVVGVLRVRGLDPGGYPSIPVIDLPISAASLFVVVACFSAAVIVLFRWMLLVRRGRFQNRG